MLRVLTWKPFPQSVPGPATLVPPTQAPSLAGAESLLSGIPVPALSLWLYMHGLGRSSDPL